MIDRIRMHGAGNRFLIGCETAALGPEAGDDGVLLLSPPRAEGDLYMRIINADGSEGEQCGNGLRCVAMHAVKSGLVEGREVLIETAAGTVACMVDLDAASVEVDLGIPRLRSDACGVTDLGREAGLPPMTFVDMGNPNAVHFVDQSPGSICSTLGPRVAEHAGFTRGMNLHVVRMDDAGACTCATWERGVGPTLACGTGAASVFAAAREAGTCSDALAVMSDGGTLYCRWSPTGSALVRGPAAYV